MAQHSGRRGADAGIVREAINQRRHGLGAYRPGTVQGLDGTQADLQVGISQEADQVGHGGAGPRPDRASAAAADRRMSALASCKLRISAGTASVGAGPARPRVSRA